MPLERVEPAGPLGAVGLEPGVELHQWLRPQPVEAPLGVTSDFHQPRIAQHLEMPRHPRLVHADSLDEVVDRLLRLPDSVEDSPTRRFGDHLEDVERSWHPVSICHRIYMCNQI